MFVLLLQIQVQVCPRSDLKQFDTDNVVQGSGGSGFGLKIAEGMVDLHDGRVGVSSNGVGKGSTFHVDLPLFIHDLGVHCNTTVDSTGLISHIGMSTTNTTNTTNTTCNNTNTNTTTTTTTTSNIEYNKKLY